MPSGSALLRRLRADDLTLDEAATLVPNLQIEPLTIRLPACDALRSLYLERTKQHARSCQELARDLGKVVATVQRDQLGKDGADAAAAAQKQALAISRHKDLSKERIHADIDPLFAQIEALLWPATERVHTAAPELQARFDQLQPEREQLQRAWALYGESTLGLELHPDAAKHFAKVVPPPAPLPAAALNDEWTVWTLLGLGLSGRDQKVLEANEALRATSDPEEFAGVTALNRLRFLLGLPLLRIDPKLSAAARDHSTDMVTLGFFAHESPVAGKRTPGDRASRFGSSAGAENIAAGQETGAGAIKAWWYSPGHHKNLLGGHGRVGLGRHEQTWTQMFGG